MSGMRRVFPGALKREAVDRMAASGPSAGVVAREPGLHETVLRQWTMQFGAQTTGRRALHHAGAGPFAV